MQLFILKYSKEALNQKVKALTLNRYLSSLILNLP